MNKKVYFIGNGLEGCYYVRCLLPLRVNGWFGDRISLTGEALTLEQSARISIQSDIIVFHRPDDEQKLKAALMLKKLGKKIVYDNDDTYKINDEMKIGESLARRSEILDEFIKIADLVTCSTEFLAKEYRELNKNVVVLPNCIDPKDWETPKRNETDKIRIGLVGSVASNGEAEHILPALKELGKNPKVQLILFGLPAEKHNTKEIVKLYKSDFNTWEGLNIEWQPIVPMRYYIKTLNNLRLDIMVIPRKDNYFNHCKSNIKFLEASMLEIPVIAQGFKDGLSPYQKREDSERMNIILDNNIWLSEIIKLAEDKNKREAIGKSAKQYVLKNYNINNNGVLWRNAYEKI